jgi:hypothetical protein
MATTKTNLSKIGAKNILAQKTPKVFFGKIFVDSDFALICFGGSHMLWEVRVPRFLV